MFSAQDDKICRQRMYMYRLPFLHIRLLRYFRHYIFPSNFFCRCIWREAMKASIWHFILWSLFTCMAGHLDICSSLWDLSNRLLLHTTIWKVLVFFAYHEPSNFYFKKKLKLYLFKWIGEGLYHNMLESKRNSTCATSYHLVHFSQNTKQTTSTCL